MFLYLAIITFARLSRLKILFMVFLVVLRKCMLALCRAQLVNKAGPKPNMTSWGLQERATHGMIQSDLKRAKSSSTNSTTFKSMIRSLSSTLHPLRIKTNRRDSSRTFICGEPSNKSKSKSGKGGEMRHPRSLEQSLSYLRASVLIMFPPSRRRLLASHKHLLQGITYRRLSR